MHWILGLLFIMAVMGHVQEDERQKQRIERLEMRNEDNDGYNYDDGDY